MDSEQCPVSPAQSVARPSVPRPARWPGSGTGQRPVQLGDRGRLLKRPVDPVGGGGGGRAIGPLLPPVVVVRLAAVVVVVVLVTSGGFSGDADDTGVVTAAVTAAVTGRGRHGGVTVESRRASRRASGRHVTTADRRQRSVTPTHGHVIGATPTRQPRSSHRSLAADELRLFCVLTARYPTVEWILSFNGTQLSG